MPHLVHIAPDSQAKKIRRNGIAPTPFRPDRARHPEHDRVVWALPVLPSFTLTHQWLREIKRCKCARTLAAVTFRIRDGEPVYVCHYHELPRWCRAAEAVRHIQTLTDPRGYQMLIPRRIRPREIVRIRVLARGIGWRYWPEAKNSRHWPCDCPACAPKGLVKSKRYRDRLPELQRRWEAKAGN